MLQTLFAVALKEFRHFWRDLPEVQSVIVAQALQIILLAFIDLNAHSVTTVIVDQDVTSESRELVQKLRATETFDIKYSTTSIDQAREHIRAGRARVAVVIPPEYGGKRARHAEADVLALVDGSDPNLSVQAINAISGVTAQITAEARGPEANLVRPHKILLFNPEGKTSNFTLPGLLAILLMSEWAYVAGAALAREREQETLERLLMTPLNLWGYLFGKITPHFAFALFNALTLLAIIHFVFAVPINGSFFLLLLAMVGYCLTLVSLGAYFAAEAESEQEVGGRLAELQFPALFLSGYVFPLATLPGWLLPLAYILPPTHMIEVMRGVALRGVGLNELWPSFIYLLGAPAALGLLAVRKFRRSINR